MNDSAPANRLVRHKLQVHFDAHHYQPTAEELGGLADDLDPLARQVGNFPQADCRVVIEHRARSNEYAVKLSLLLPGETLVTSDHDPALNRGQALVVRAHAFALPPHAPARRPCGRD